MIIFIQEYSIVTLCPFTWQITSYTNGVRVCVTLIMRSNNKAIFIKIHWGIKIAPLILNSDLYSLKLADQVLVLEQNNYSLACNNNSTDVSNSFQSKFAMIICCHRFFSSRSLIITLNFDALNQTGDKKLLNMYCPFKPENNFRRIVF